MKVARRFVFDAYRHVTNGSVPTLHYWRDSWMVWRNGYYREISDGEMLSRLYRTFEHATYDKEKRGGEFETVPWNPNRKNIGDALDALRSVTHLGAEVSPQAWIRPIFDSPGWEDHSHKYRTAPYPPDYYLTRNPADIIPCANGLLCVPDRALLPHTPSFFNLSRVPFDWNPCAPEPAQWLAFLNQLWPDDPESIQTLQEYFGYVLSGRTDIQKMLLTVGPKRGGKGTIAQVLKALVGEYNTVNPTLASLGQNFGLAPLLGKSLATISDARLANTLSGAQSSQILERLLSISGEDDLTVDRKYRTAWTGKLPCRIAMFSNELPRFNDASGAIASRFIILQLERSWLGKEDPHLLEKLRKELPGIFRWSLEGLDSLRKRGYFITPQTSQESQQVLAELTSPHQTFIDEHCVLGPLRETPIIHLFNAWRAWCDANGYQRSGSMQTFARDLHTIRPELRTKRPRSSEDASRPRYLVGIALDPEHPAPPFGPYGMDRT